MTVLLKKKHALDLVIFAVPEPDGMCPAPDSQVFEGLCSMPPCGPDVCDGGKICCYSNECGVEVCVMPEEPQSKRDFI